MTSKKKEFSWLRSVFWPVHGHEVKVFLPMLVLAFFIGFNYSVLKSLKDSLIVTAKGSGAEVLPFLKVWGMIPGAVLMTMFYGMLSSRFRQEIVFYLIISFFIGFFLLFAFFIYPRSESFHLDRLADWLTTHLPKGLFGLVAIIRVWSFTLFYVISELWSSTVLSMLFWGFANRITTLDQAPRFFVMLHLALSFSSIAAGEVTVWVSQPQGGQLVIPFAIDAWHEVIIGLTLLLAIAGVVIVLLYRYIYNLNFFTGSLEDIKGKNDKVILEGSKEHIGKRRDEAKIKMKLQDIIRALVRSRYLLCLSGIVLSYNLVIHIVEVLWKHQAKILYADSVTFNMYMGRITSVTGVVSGLCCCLITGQMIKRWGWRFGALVTPVVFLVTGIFFFFTLMFYGNSNLAHGVLGGWVSSPLALIVFFGGVQNVLSRVAKYSFFDATKEMAFVPLSEKAKIQGKALIDGILSRCGKSAAAFFFQAFFLLFSNLSAMVPIIALVFFIMLGIWFVAVFSLGRRFEVIIRDSERKKEENRANDEVNDIAHIDNVDHVKARKTSSSLASKV